MITDKIIRSATIENMADENGIVNVEKLSDLYNKISAKTIITGFTYVSENGRAMQKLQAGMVTPEHQKAWSELVKRVKSHTPDKKLFIQLAHTGRQTTRDNAVGAGNKKCSYFKNKVRVLNENEIKSIVQDFAKSAKMAKEAGFDGVQVHAAHGYLIHQFLSPHTNMRKDKYKDGNLFLVEILNAVRSACGADFPIWVKVSWADDKGMTLKQTIETVKRIEGLVDNIEVSYGTMEYALNIIRGNCPTNLVFEVNPLFNKYPKFIKSLAKKVLESKYLKIFKPFSKNYNLQAALEIKKNTKTPVTVVGGIRELKDIEEILNSGIDMVSMCRPFICEPDLVDKINSGEWQKSACTNCNLCTIYCDSEIPDGRSPVSEKLKSGNAVERLTASSAKEFQESENSVKCYRSKNG